MPTILPRQAFGAVFLSRTANAFPSQQLPASRPALRLPAAAAQGVAALESMRGIIFSPRTRSKWNRMVACHPNADTCCIRDRQPENR
ncbi:hypothetical protein GCM10007881_27290 [Mesorhizobium huakuii]|nr:hypothetical protein GCM10007881_27290 [Mesorhizobium huakuii]